MIMTLLEPLSVGLLESKEGFKVVGEARSGEEAVRIAREVQPDVVLMDVKMPGIGGLEATRKLTSSIF